MNSLTLSQKLMHFHLEVKNHNNELTNQELWLGPSEITNWQNVRQACQSRLDAFQRETVSDSKEQRFCANLFKQIQVDLQQLGMRVEAVRERVLSTLISARISRSDQDVIQKAFWGFSLIGKAFSAHKGPLPPHAMQIIHQHLELVSQMLAETSSPVSRELIQRLQEYVDQMGPYVDINHN